MSRAPDSPASGWFAVWRQFTDTEHPEHPTNTGEPACRAFAWVDLVGMARFAEGDGLGRGQLRTSLRILADRWNWTKSKTERWVREKIEAGAIAWDTSERAGRGHFTTVVTVCNYDTYQPKPPPARDTYATPSVGHPGTLSRDTSEGRWNGVDNRPARDTSGTGGKGGRTPRSTVEQHRERDTSGAVENGHANGAARDTSVGHQEGNKERARAKKLTLSVGVGVSSDLPSSAVKTGNGPAEDAKSHDEHRTAERLRARDLIRSELHLGADTIRVAGHAIGVQLELRKWDAMVDRGMVNPRELNGALSLLRDTPEALPDDLRDQPVTMAWLESQPGVLALLVGQFHKRE